MNVITSFIICLTPMKFEFSMISWNYNEKENTFYDETKDWKSFVTQRKSTLEDYYKIFSLYA